MTQTLFSLTLTAETAAGLVRSDPDRAETEIARVLELAKATQAELRSLIFQLRPADLEAHGLVSTLRTHTELLGRVHRLPIRLHITGEPLLEPETELGVFRIVQEALHNALRHAAAEAVDVTFEVADTTLTVRVSDDGVGFDPSSRRVRSHHLGLTSMRERARALRGRLRVDAAPGQGTTVALEVPL